MKYSKLNAKDYARENMKGIWAAAMNPFNEDFSFNEEGLRRNIRHWIDDLAIQGLFIAGKQGEFATMSLDERKRNMEIAVEECGDKAGTIMSCSDQNFDVVVELARHAEAVGADYIVVHAPMLHFITDRDDTVYNYYKSVCDQRKHRHRHVEPPGFRIPDEPGAVQPGGRAAQHRGHQVLGAPAHVRRPDAIGR